jgi:RNA polymerase sigma-70 factor, ECF subfamily
MPSHPDEVSALLCSVAKGDRDATSLLLPIVYAELRRLAAHYMQGERPGQTIQPTELVHEAYLRLVGRERVEWEGRAHFFAMAATSMRRILVDRARKKKAEKHGGGRKRMQLDDALVFSRERSKELIALDEALTRLERVSPRQSRIVELKFFGGLQIEEIAEIEAVSPTTVKQDWAVARAWLHHELVEVE